MVYGKSMTDALVSGPGSLISRRSLFKAVGMGTAVLGTVGCSSEPLKRNSLSSTSASSAPATGEPRRGSSRRKWVHFGDSFTRLSQVAPACAAITGFRHMDASITGDNSLTAAIRSGSEPLRARIDGPNIPAQGSVEILDLDPTGFRMLEDWEYKVEIQGVRGAIIRDKPSKKTLFTREREGEAVDVSGQVEILMDPGHAQATGTESFHLNYSVVFALGRNDIDLGGSIDDLVKNIRTMIEKHPAADLRYVVTDIPAWQEEKNGTPQREKLDAWNGRLKQEFGDSFIETFRWLIDHRKETFALAEQKMTDRDRAGEGDGVIPASLTLGDRGHLNRAGGKAWAAILVEELKRLHLV
jgi:hypothetical protein